MSQKVTRKSVTVVAEDKEKTDSPVKEMKKKIAANAEKEKQATEKVDKPDKPVEKNDKTENGDKKPTEKRQDDKADKNEKTDKHEKSDKNEKSEKNEKLDKVAEKKSEKTDKGAEKKPEKTDKGDKKADKSIEKKLEDKKEDGKGDKSKEKTSKPNGTHNGQAGDANGTVSDDSADELVEDDELFPELTYDESDTDAFEPDAPSRSLTRRSQVKVTKTPETPRPASERDSDHSKESKLLKLKEDSVAPSDRKLRSADSPKPESKKEKKQDSPKKQEGQEEEKSAKKEQADNKDVPEDGNTEDKAEKDDDVIILEPGTTEAAPRTRARVSPYTHTHTHAAAHAHVRLDRTHSSAMADYTGNNSTMEMDITESSSILEDPNDSAYLRGLRGIRGRASYKLLSEIKLTNPNAGRPRPAPPLLTSPPLSRPTGAVVGRKRKPSDTLEVDDVEVGVEAEDDLLVAHGKRMRLLDRLAMPFRRNINRRAAEIVGINTDLPLTAPVASPPTFDPETMKPSEPVATPLPAPLDHDSKRCVLM